MIMQTKEELLGSELAVLSVLRARLNSAVELFDANTAAIEQHCGFDKAKAYINETREVLKLLKKHEKYLSDLLKSEYTQKYFFLLF